MWCVVRVGALGIYAYTHIYVSIDMYYSPTVRRERCDGAEVEPEGDGLKDAEEEGHLVTEGRVHEAWVDWGVLGGWLGGWLVGLVGGCLFGGVYYARFMHPPTLARKGTRWGCGGWVSLIQVTLARVPAMTMSWRRE